MDKAYNWTSAQLRALERRIKETYTAAYKSCKKEMADVLARIAEHPEWDDARRLIEMQKYDRLDNLCRQMADTIDDANKEAIRFINGSSVNVFRENYNWQARSLGFDIIDNTAARNILTGISNPFTKLSMEGLKDEAGIRRQLESELITGLLKGESIRDIARRIRTVTERPLSDCVRIARTETTYAQNSARQSVGEHGEELGFKMLKEWRATEDGRTRDAHHLADGQRVPVDEPFVVDGEELMFPGDFSLGASPENTINCRCTVVYVIDKGEK